MSVSLYLLTYYLYPYKEDWPITPHERCISEEKLPYSRLPPQAAEACIWMAQPPHLNMSYTGRALDVPNALSYLFNIAGQGLRENMFGLRSQVETKRI